MAPTNPPWIEHHQDRYARGVAALLRHGDRWLDVGAGTKIHDGSNTHPPDELASRARSFVGCDLVVDHLHRNPYLTAAVGASSYQLPFATGSFELITANMVLEHLEDPSRAFAEIARVLAPGGHFVFVTPNRLNPIIGGAFALLSTQGRSRLAHLVEGRADEHVFPTFYRANSDRALRALAMSAGLAIAELETFSTVPFTQEMSPPLRALELAFIRALTIGKLRQLQSNLFGVLRKAPAS